MTVKHIFRIAGKPNESAVKQTKSKEDTTEKEEKEVDEIEDTLKENENEDERDEDQV